MSREYFLSFDAATKTLAFVLLSIDRGAAAALRERTETLKYIRAQLQPALECGYTPELEAVIDALATEADAIAAESGDLVTLHAGDVSDLFPDRADKSITEQERIRAVRDYVDALVRPAVESLALPADSAFERVRVLIEYQMSSNFKSRSVATTLAALLIDHSVTFVMPILKNRIFFAPDLHYGLIAKKYKTTYAANKRHAVLNTQLLAELFGLQLNTRKGLLSHISDAIMQVFGQIKFGDVPRAPPKEAPGSKSGAGPRRAGGRRAAAPRRARAQRAGTGSETSPPPAKAPPSGPAKAPAVSRLLRPPSTPRASSAAPRARAKAGSTARATARGRSFAP
jgi:hypothetical protein